MAFYLLFGVAIFFAKGRIALIFPGLVFCLVLFCGLQVLPTIVLEFGLGILVAIYFKRAPRGTKFTAILALLAGLFGVLGLWFSLTGGFADDWRFAALGIPSTLILLAAVMMPQVSATWVEVLGSASYGIYLWQVLTIPITAPLVRMLVGDDFPLVLIFTPLITTILIGVLSDRYFDKPLRAFLNKVAPAGKQSRGL